MKYYSIQFEKYLKSPTKIISMKNLTLILGLFVISVSCKSKDTEIPVSSNDSISVDTTSLHQSADTSKLTTIPDDTVQIKSDTMKAVR